MHLYIDDRFLMQTSREGGNIDEVTEMVEEVTVREVTERGLEEVTVREMTERGLEEVTQGELEGVSSEECSSVSSSDPEWEDEANLQTRDCATGRGRERERGETGRRRGRGRGRARGGGRGRGRRREQERGSRATEGCSQTTVLLDSDTQRG